MISCSIGKSRGAATIGHVKYLVTRGGRSSEDHPSNERGGGGDRMQDDRLLAGGATEESGVRSKKPPVKVDGEVDVTPRDEESTQPGRPLRNQLKSS